MRDVLFADIETESDLDLTEVTTPVYAGHPTTRVERMGWIFRGSAGTWVPSATKNAPPATLLDAMRSADLIAFFNAEFDFTVIREKLPELALPSSKLMCMQHRALASGLRKVRKTGESALSLRDVLELMNAPADVQKLSEEQIALTGYSWASQKKSAGLFAVDTAAQEAARDAYVLGDVRAIEWLHSKLPMLTEFELECFRSCLAMNLAGMPIDRVLLERVHTIGLQAATEAERKFTEATGLRPTQRQAVQDWLKARGVELKDMTRETLNGALAAGTIPPDMARLVLWYTEVGAKPHQKFAEILRLAQADDRLRGTIRHAVAHTGRDVGRHVNLHNNRRPDLDRDGQTALAEFVRSGASLKEVEIIYGSAAIAMTNLQRAVFMAPEGKFFADGDFTRAEPMVGFWLTGEKDGEKPYHEIGVRIANGMRAGKSRDEWLKLPIIANLGLPAGADVVGVDHISKSSVLYTTAKSAFLGSGYGQQAKGLHATLADRGINIPMEVAQAAVKACRDAKPKTFAMADEVMAALVHAAAGRSTKIANGKLIVRPYALGVEIGLPSGRAIRYRQLKAHRYTGQWGMPRLEISYTPDVVKSATGKELVQRIHVGTILENVFSAIARDFLYEATNRAVREGLEVVVTIHDQILSLVGGEEGRAHLEEIMNAPTPWSQGFAMKAEVELTKRFVK